MSANTDRRHINGVMVKTNVHLGAISSHDLAAVSALQHRQPIQSGAPQYKQMIETEKMTLAVSFAYNLRLGGIYPPLFLSRLSSKFCLNGNTVLYILVAPSSKCSLNLKWCHSIQNLGDKRL